MKIRFLSVLLLASVACSNEARPVQTIDLDSLAGELVPGIESAVGLSFRYPPNVASRSTEEVRLFLLDKLATDFPEEEVEWTTTAYKLFGLIPDTLDLMALLVDLYAEQVVGFYDPSSDSLFIVEGADQSQVFLIMAHELVHALQAQHAPIEEMLGAKRQNDRTMAAQAVLEGQGMLASLKGIMPDLDVDAMPSFWYEYRESVRREQSRMPVFNEAPLLLQETLVFPYLYGADFVRWFERNYPDTLPFGPRLPESTEQILRPQRYRDGDRPVELEFQGDRTPVYVDNLGEFEIRLLIQILTDDENRASSVSAGWGGDKYGLFETNSRDALVWYSVWDQTPPAERFHDLMEELWIGQALNGRERRVSLVSVNGRGGVMAIDGPQGWDGFSDPPMVTISENQQ